MAIPVIEERDFEREVLRSELPVLVDFYADWCGPCKTMEPEVVALAHELNGKAKVVKVNTDRSKVLAQRLRIQSVPTTMVFAGGRIAAAEVGALRRDQTQADDRALPPARRRGATRRRRWLSSWRNVRWRWSIRGTRPSTRACTPRRRQHPLCRNRATGWPSCTCFPPSRSSIAARGEQAKELAGRLASEGTPVAFLEGGVLAWEAEGLPVERPD